MGGRGCDLHRSADALAGAGLALDDGIDDLKVGGIGGEPDLDLFARRVSRTAS
jgi:hypothetical protein